MLPIQRISPERAPVLVEALRRVLTALGSPAKPDQIYQALAEAALLLLPAQGVTIAVVEPDGRALRVKAGAGLLACHQGELLPIEGSFEGSAVITGELRRTDNLAEESSGYRPDDRRLPYGPALAASISALGRPLGVVLLAPIPSTGRGFTEEDGSILQFLCETIAAVMENVTEFEVAQASRMRMERWRREQDLAFWNARFVQGASLVRAGIFEWDVVLDRFLWGPTSAFSKHLPEQFGSSLSSWLVHVHGEDRSSLREAFLGARDRVGEINHEFRVVVPGAGERRMLVRALPNASRTSLTGVIEDVTEHALEVERLQTEAVHQAMRSLRHDLTDPLAIILGYAQLLRENISLRADARTQHAYESIQQGVNRLSALFRRLPSSDDQPVPIAVRGAALPVTDAPSWDLTDAFVGILENLTDGVLIMDADHVVRYANTRVETIVGKARGQFIGRDVCELLPAQLNRETLLERFERHMNGTSEIYEIHVPGTEGSHSEVAEVSGGPYRDASGEIIGVLYTLTDATKRRRSEHRLREVALQDPLTGLPNRTLLIERLQNAVSRSRRHEGHQFSVLFIDIDHLKHVNDSLGHPAGDALLVAVARRLQVCLRPEDTVARFGGDEFAVLLEGIQGVTDATRIALRIQEDLAAPVDVGNYEISTSASIGIALSSAGSETAEQLLHNADAAMYRAKSMGRGRYEIFDREMHVKAVERLKTEVELRSALEKDQLRLRYQPIVSLESRKIVAVEALLRWEHPEHGELQPSDFISLAEESRLILPIGRWVLQQACHQMRDWRARFGDSAPGWVAVNLSAKQLVQPGFAKEVQEIVRQAGIEPEWLTLEITETMLSDHERVAGRMLTELIDFGVRINMDGFGTGYSSLQTLHRLRIDALKIDSSFIQRIQKQNGETVVETDRTAHLIRIMLSVATGVGATTIADGIDSNWQLSELQRMGCLYGQGFLFSGAVDVEELNTLVQSGSLGVG